MKHVLPKLGRWVWLVSLLVPVAAKAQTKERRTSIGVLGNALQYQGRLGSDYWKWQRNQYAPGLAINQYLGRGLDLNTQLLYAELRGRSTPNRFFATTLINFNLGLKLKLNNGWALKENAVVQPYLLAGTGWTFAARTGQVDTLRFDNQQGYLDMYAGAGLSLRLGPVVRVFVQSSQHLPLRANLDGLSQLSAKSRSDRFLQHAVGLSFNLGQMPDTDEDGVSDALDACPRTPSGVEVDQRGCPLDSDQDGTPDYQDNCPEQVGKQELNGCPDADNDGVPDSEDTCPDEAGLPALQGCPDTDGDGVPDKDDNCLDTPAGATVDAAGCTVGASRVAPDSAATAVSTLPDDTDADGVANAADRCPTIPGPASNRGCPELPPTARAVLRQATQHIGFELNKAALLPSSYAVLDSVAQLLRRYPSYSLSIAGHTDSRGPAAFNLRLARERAAAARTYLIEKGIAAARVEARGYAARHPLATNATEAGRTRNRRVEFDLFLTGEPSAAQVKYGPEPTAASVTTRPAQKNAVKKSSSRKLSATSKRRQVPGQSRQTGRRTSKSSKTASSKR